MNKMDIILSKINERTDINSIKESLSELNIEYKIIEKDKKLKYNIEESVVEQRNILLSNAEISTPVTKNIELPLNISKSTIGKRTVVEKGVYKANFNKELIA
ncbi:MULTISPECIES: hypothetical protein [Staphylococcus]|nr:MULTISPECIES: hypothetical protein [Staphylococcus]MBE7337489.1 hypothetical protein [Staphylococcus epidermidis]